MIKAVIKNSAVFTGAVPTFTHTCSSPPVLFTFFEQMKCQHRSSVSSGMNKIFQIRKQQLNFNYGDSLLSVALTHQSLTSHSTAISNRLLDTSQELSSSSSSSSSSPLCRVIILIFLRQTVSLGNTVLQLFCCYYSLCLYVVCQKSIRPFFLCEHLMDYNLARLHEPTLNLSAHA